MKNLLLLLLPLVLFSACSNNENQQTSSGEVFPDSLFVYHNLSDTRSVNHFYYASEYASGMYVDSTKKQQFKVIDSTTLKRLVGPFLGIDTNYVAQYMTGHYISKQDKIFDLTPIIILVEGDDFQALEYILTDDKGKAISLYTLRGGECGGPIPVNDSIQTFCPVRNMTLNGSTFKGYELHIYENINRENAPCEIDSILNTTTFDAHGYFNTIRTDSIHYSRKINYEAEGI